jgi:hypothetical protein
MSPVEQDKWYTRALSEPLEPFRDAFTLFELARDEFSQMKRHNAHM